MKNVLITGASGFIGEVVCKELDNEQSLKIVKTSRLAKTSEGFVKAPSLNENADWSELLKDIDIVVHLAGRAHILKDDPKKAYQKFIDVNYLGTMQLAKQAKELGVKKFIFMSSIGVNAGLAGKEIITENSEYAPVQDYAISKMKAELGLQSLFKDSKCQLIMIRPPLVYGKDAPGNFGTLSKLVKAKIPVPIGNFENCRSVVSVRNLADFIKCSVLTELESEGIFIISDDNTKSTSDLIKFLCIGIEQKNTVFKFSRRILTFMCKLLGKDKLLTKFVGDFVVDNSKIKNEFNWQPPYTTESELKLVGKSLKKEGKKC